jgi:RHS repeat-associated protein
MATVTYDTYSRIQTIDYPAGIKLSSITRDSLGRENSNTFTLASGQTIKDQIVRATSGDIISGIENGVTKSYTYDQAGRLTTASLGANTFSYSFAPADTACNGLAGNNPNAGKNGNRTKMTINGVTTTYCYDQADRLIASSDPTLTTPTYDSHGNTLSLGDATRKTIFSYDTSDRNTYIKQSTSSQTLESTYTRDVQGRVIRREAKTNGSVTSDVSYSFTGNGDTPDALLNATGTVIQKYITLPGDIIATIIPGDNTPTGTTYSIPNIHGDVMATINALGVTVASHMTGPFGEVLASNPISPSNTATGTSWNYVGQNQKLTESNYALTPIQMGARVYLPTLGRFTAVDPTEGGTDNNYAYANDPVNEFDLSGNIVETIADVAAIAYDIHEMYKKPSWGNAGMLAWSVAAAIVPVVPGSYAGRAGSAAIKASKGAAPSATKKVTKESAKIVRQGSRGGIGAGKPFPNSVKKAVRAEETRCAYCRRLPLKSEIDHIIPKVKGGNNTRQNAQLTCQHCNRSKGSGNYPKTPPAGYRGKWPYGR